MAAILVSEVSLPDSRLKSITKYILWPMWMITICQARD